MCAIGPALQTGDVSILMMQICKKADRVTIKTDHAFQKQKSLWSRCQWWRGCVIRHGFSPVSPDYTRQIPGRILIIERRLPTPAGVHRVDRLDRAGCVRAKE